MQVFSSAFHKQPWQYGAGQGTHAFMGLTFSVYLLAAFPDLSWWAVAAIAFNAYFWPVEVLWQRLVLFWDSVEDTLHFTLGAASGALIASGHMYLAGVALAGQWLVIAYGYGKRL